MTLCRLACDSTLDMLWIREDDPIFIAWGAYVIFGNQRVTEEPGTGTG